MTRNLSFVFRLVFHLVPRAARSEQMPERTSTGHGGSQNEVPWESGPRRAGLHGGDGSSQVFRDLSHGGRELEYTTGATTGPT